MRNVITRSLGSDPAPSPDVWVLPPTPGERFIVCSDGLSDELDDREIMLVARQYDDPQIAADQLVAAAVRAGGRDNVSVVVVAVDSGADDGEDDADTAPRTGLLDTWLRRVAALPGELVPKYADPGSRRHRPGRRLPRPPSTSPRSRP